MVNTDSSGDSPSLAWHVATLVEENAREAVNKSTSLASAAVVLVAALAWNSAFQTTFKRVSWLHRSGPWAYAILVTIFAVVLVRMMNCASAVLVSTSASVP